MDDSRSNPRSILEVVVPCDEMTTRTARNDRLQLLDGLLDELEELNLRDIAHVPAPLAQRLADSGVVVLGGTVSQGLTAVWTEQSRRGPQAL